MQKEKASPTIPLPKYNEAVQNYNTITGITVATSTTAFLEKDNWMTMNTLQIQFNFNHFPEEAFKYRRPQREGSLPYELKT